MEQNKILKKFTRLRSASYFSQAPEQELELLHNIFHYFLKQKYPVPDRLKKQLRDSAAIIRRFASTKKYSNLRKIAKKIPLNVFRQISAWSLKIFLKMPHTIKYVQELRHLNT